MAKKGTKQTEQPAVQQARPMSFGVFDHDSARQHSDDIRRHDDAHVRPKAAIAVCVGIPTDALKSDPPGSVARLVAAARKALGYIPENQTQAWDDLRAALAAFEGEGE